MSGHKFGVTSFCVPSTPTRWSQEEVKTPSCKIHATNQIVESPFAGLGKGFDLHRLPPEIRNFIYELVLASDKPINATEYPRDLVPSLLQVCCQVRQEAIPIFYARNTFIHVVRDANTARLCQWLTAVGVENCSFIGILAICCAGRIRSFDLNISFAGITQDYTALAKTCHHNSVRRDAICSFSESVDPDEFEDDEEVEHAESCIAQFHREIIPAYLDRAGYRSSPSGPDASSSEPQDPSRAAAESDSRRAIAGNGSAMCIDLRTWRDGQTARRRQSHLAAGGTQNNRSSLHESKTPMSCFFRAPDASDGPEFSAGFKNVMAMQADRAKVQQRSLATSTSGEGETASVTDALSSVDRGDAESSPLLGSGAVKRKREVYEDDMGDAPSTGSVRSVKHPELDNDIRSSGAGEKGRESATRSRKKVYVKTSRSKVIGMAVRQ